MATGLYSKHLKDRKKLYLRNTVLIIILIILALISLFPIVYMIAWSFGPAIEAASTSYSIFPKSWSLDSYKAFIQFNQYSLRWLWNSLVVAVVVVAGNVVFAGMAGYAFAKIDFKGRKFLFYMVLMAMMIPYQVIQVPLYILLVSKFQLSNTYILCKHPDSIDRERQDRRLWTVQDIPSDRAAPVQDYSGSYGDQYLFRQLEQLLLAVPGNLQGQNVHHPGRT